MNIKLLKEEVTLELFSIHTSFIYFLILWLGHRNSSVLCGGRRNNYPTLPLRCWAVTASLHSSLLSTYWVANGFLSTDVPGDGGNSLWTTQTLIFTRLGGVKTEWIRPSSIKHVITKQPLPRTLSLSPQLDLQFSCILLMWTWFCARCLCKMSSAVVAL